MKKLKNYFKGFTLVELIIVITILAILATIAFVSFQGYVSDARDANRTATIKNIEKGLELFTIKTGNFPIPDESTTFTGGLDGKVKINQGIVGDGVATIINMNTIPFDPNDKSKYTYSTFGDNHKYYQVAINAENNQTSFIPETYAFTPKSAIVKGNYRFDPSLPSLIVVPSSVNTASGIFDPKVCFVIDGGQNSLDNCVDKKEEMSLKEFDNSLLGYWDMETLSGTMLKDLSGNSHDAIFSGTYTESTGGILGKALQFHTGGYIINTSTGFNEYKNLTIKVNFFTLYNKYETYQTYHTGSNSYITYQNIISRWDCTVNCAQTGAFWTGLSDLNYGTSLYNYGITSHVYGADKIRKDSFNFTQSQILGTKQWYELIIMKEDSKKLKIYLNQKLMVESISDTEILNSQIPFYIGTAQHIIGKKASPGIIDDIKIYNRVLSDDEILQQARTAGF